MIDNLKAILRKVLNYMHLDFTKNLEYDRLTKKIISKTVMTNSTCVDVGAHKGEILDLFLKYAPKGHHLAFEPIPDMYKKLHKKYSGSCRIYPTALSDISGSTTFQFVKNAPAYSGIKKRKYEIDNPDIEEINVPMATLDSIVADNDKITFIKIDVEGAELGVLKGSKNVLLKDKPFVLFECGLGASEFYETKAEDVFDFLDNIGMKIATLKDWLRDNSFCLSKSAFCDCYTKSTEYYFLAYS